MHSKTISRISLLVLGIATVSAITLTQNKALASAPTDTVITNNQNKPAVIAISMLIATTAGLSITVNLTDRSNSETASKSQLSFTIPQGSYEQLKTEMTLSQVQGYLGQPGTEISSSRNTSEYVWQDSSTGVSIYGTFKHGKLEAKRRTIPAELFAYRP